MSSQVYDNKTINESIQKNTEENQYLELNKTKSGNKILDNMPNISGIGDTEPISITKSDITSGVVSSSGEKNAKIIEAGDIPVLNTKYVQDSFYTDTYKNESLSSLKDEFVREDKYKRKSIFGKIKEDSKEMKAIMSSVDTLVEFMSKPIVKEDDSQKFYLALENIEIQYRTIISNCTTYLFDSGKNKRNLRYAMVKRMHTTATRELSLLRTIAENTYESIVEGATEEVKWSDVLRDCRSLHYKDGENGVKITQIGANSSNVSVITLEDGKKLFFKEDDELQDLSLDDINKKIITNIQSPDNKLTEQEKETCNLFRIAVLSGVDEFRGSITEENKKKIIEAIPQIADLEARFFEVKKDSNQKDGEKKKGPKDFFKETLEGFLRKKFKFLADNPFTEYFIDTITKQIYLDTDNKSVDDAKKQIENNKKLFKDTFQAVARNIFEEGYMKNMTNLPVGAKITTNNVVTSRMADILNVDFIAKSKSTIISINGKTKKGIIMEEAKGTEIEKVRLYTPEIDEFRSALSDILGFERDKDTIINNPAISDQTKQDYLDDYNRRFQNTEAMKTCKKYMKKPADYAVTIEEIQEEYNKIETNIKNYQTTYSAKVKRDMMSLSIMDFILGQTDRHGSNFHVESKQVGEKFVITNIHAIDNDGCCGLYTGEKLNSNDYVGVRTSKLMVGSNINIPALDRQFAEKIVSLNVSVFAMGFIDLLTKPQIEAMINRLKYVQDILRPELQKLKNNQETTIKFLSTDDEWEHYGDTEEEAKKLTEYNKYFFRPHLFNSLNNKKVA